MVADMADVLLMAHNRVQNTILDCNIISSVWIDGNQLIIELENGRNFALSVEEVKHQAKQFIEEI